ncbi:hypothetical protein R0K19_00040 [Bacillus sp. SIMBA_161]
MTTFWSWLFMILQLVIYLFLRQLRGKGTSQSKSGNVQTPDHGYAKTYETLIEERDLYFIALINSLDPSFHVYAVSKCSKKGRKLCAVFEYFS